MERKRQRAGKARKKKRDRGIETREKRGQREREKGMEGERKKGGGIIQLFQETDRLKTFRGGICERDSEILSPIKGISGGLRGMLLTKKTHNIGPVFFKMHSYYRLDFDKNI